MKSDLNPLNIASGAAHSKSLFGYKNSTVNIYTITLACIRSLLIREWLSP